MQIEVLDFVAGAREARGVAVVIDVFRAFSVACYAFARGAKRIIPVAEVERALELRRQHPDYLVIGEREGRMVEGFHYGGTRPRKYRRWMCAGKPSCTRRAPGRRASQARCRRTWF
jgi:phosphosulfolactate phosphohydrolase-like enzyme